MWLFVGWDLFVVLDGGLGVFGCCCVVFGGGMGCGGVGDWDFDVLWFILEYDVGGLWMIEKFL